jgi:hypothetical protein
MDIQLLAARLGSMSRFLLGTKPHPNLPGFAYLPLIFLQATYPHEDEEEHQFRCNLGFGIFEEKYGHLPPQVHYLHTETNWLGFLVGGSYRSRTRRVRPLNPYTSRGEPRAWIWRENPMILGYRIPDYPKILGVDNQIATEYLARILIHDLGHGFMPNILTDRENLHSVTMLLSMGVNQTIGRNTWERFVHQECTDPYFFLSAREHLMKVRPTYRELTTTQRFLLKRIDEMYLKNRDENEENGRLWGISSDLSPEEKKRRIDAVVERMCQSGFVHYKSSQPLP